MYEVGFMLGCFLSERYYTSNVQRRAVILAYSMTTCSGISLALFKLYASSINNFEIIVVIGYTLSGLGQSLLIIVMVAYATPYIKLYPKSALLPVLVGLLNFSGAVGGLLSYLISNYEYSGYLNLGLNAILLTASILISWKLKQSPRRYSISVSNKPDIPFSYFSLTFYTYGVRFIKVIYSVYSSVLTRELIEYKVLKFTQEICVFQGIYSLSYSIGAALVFHFISNAKKNIGIPIMILGFLITTLGLFLTNVGFKTMKNKTNFMILVYLIDSMLGMLDGIVEPLILHKIVTRSNRPEFFTGLFYCLASISAVMVVSLSSYFSFRNFNNIIFALFFVLMNLSANILNQ